MYPEGEVVQYSERLEDEFVEWDQMKPLWWPLDVQGQLEFLMMVRSEIDPDWAEFPQTTMDVDQLVSVVQGSGITSYSAGALHRRYGLLICVDLAIEVLEHCREIPCRNFPDTLQWIKALSPEQALCYTKGLLLLAKRKPQLPLLHSGKIDDDVFHPISSWPDIYWSLIEQHYRRLLTEVYGVDIVNSPRREFLQSLNGDSWFYTIRQFFERCPQQEGRILCPLNQQELGYLINKLSDAGGIPYKKNKYRFTCQCVVQSDGTRYKPNNMAKQVYQVDNDHFVQDDTLLFKLIASLPPEKIQWAPPDYDIGLF